MAGKLIILGALLSVVLGGYASPTSSKPSNAEPDQALAVSVTSNGVTYINKGIVGFGLIPSNFKDSVGDTIGGIGSAITLKRGTWKRSHDGTYTGTLLVQPDRGYNVITTIDYQARHHEIGFVLSPYYGTGNQTFTDAQKTLELKYLKTTLHWDRNNVKTSGLDALGVRPAERGYPQNPDADPEMPIANATYQHLSIDAEGLVENPDGTIWVSDEYGPYIYHFTKDGNLIQTIQPPSALLPRTATGALNFTASTDPATGRIGNQGLEGLTIDASGKTLYALLQSATAQDGGLGSTTSRYTRLLAYDISNAHKRPQLKGEWVVGLPLTKKGKTQATSEVHYVKENVFLTLARDGGGRGGSDNTSSYKQADLFDISQATDIHNTPFDDPTNPIAVNGTLNSSITPAKYVPFVSLINSTQLGRFGLHNGDPDDPTLINSKWESLALAPCDDPKYPNDYFLFTASDNDFLTTDGVFQGTPYNGGIDVDNEFLVFRLTLPGAEIPPV